MIDVIPLLLASVAGMGLSVFFFGGLWLTVRWLPTTRWPALLTLGSFLGRMVVTLAGFYLVGVGHWDRMLACLIGFVIMRFIVVAWLRPAEAGSPSTPNDKEAGSP